MSPKDQLGKFGEALVETELCSFFGGPSAIFWPVRLGEKFPVYDYMVKLEGKLPGGAFFFAKSRRRESVSVAEAGSPVGFLRTM